MLQAGHDALVSQEANLALVLMHSGHRDGGRGPDGQPACTWEVRLVFPPCGLRAVDQG